MLVVRVVVALVLAYLGALFAFGGYLAMMWQIHPWPGGHRSTPGAVTFGLLMAALVVAPMVAWWFLVPRARWWGIPVTALCAAATFAAFSSNI
ncbi:hypothetical protein ODJ79_06995 [Actinoplanes sp. KI2]|uniref:hypothetical protein n=1 Tax=Actinoplanes sp. KI2 TaxID=2983315 RepID=UPI0021D58976|nr:hypothetical protein [Actinoplanes sp. KI2]MCU7723453.1 hypothetical protein [Actinoplanes sp. KI2]